MTSEEQARELARRLAYGYADSQHSHRCGGDVEGQCAECDERTGWFVEAILPALRTREAETWEQAAQVATNRHAHNLAAELRARAAQPQEPEKV